MPIYEYECTGCGNTLEVLQKFSDQPLSKCKQCSGKLQKLVSQSSFHLKGTGWYVTDYADKSKTSTSSCSPKSDAKAETSSSTSASSSTPTDKPVKAAKSTNNDT